MVTNNTDQDHLTICDTDHDLTELTNVRFARPVPDKPGWYFLRLKDGNIISYDSVSKVISYWATDIIGFRAAMVDPDSVLLPTHQLTVLDTDTCIGDAVARLLLVI